MGDFFAFINDPWISGEEENTQIPFHIDNESIDVIGDIPTVIVDDKSIPESVFQTPDIGVVVQPLNDLHKRVVHFVVMLIHRLENVDKVGSEMFALAIDCKLENIGTEQLPDGKIRIAFFVDNNDSSQHTFETNELYYLPLLRVISMVSSAQTDFMNRLAVGMKNLPATEDSTKELMTYLKRLNVFITRSNKLLSKAEKLLV
jgi:hypothetical protein